MKTTLNQIRACSPCKSEKRLYAFRCARRVQHLMTDQRSLDALDVAERHAYGLATDQELTDAEGAAWDAWTAAEGVAARSTRSAAWPAAWAARSAWAATWAARAARAAARSAGSEQEKDLREMCAATDKYIAECNNQWESYEQNRNK